MLVDWGSTVVLLGGPCPSSSETQVPGSNLEKRQIHRFQMWGHPTPPHSEVQARPSHHLDPFSADPAPFTPPGAKISSL